MAAMKRILSGNSGVAAFLLSFVFLFSATFGTGEIRAQERKENAPSSKGGEDGKGEKKSLPKLAVLELKPGPGVPKTVTRILSDLIRTGIVKSRLFVVIDRDSIAVIMKEQAFQQSGCTETSCAIQIGRLLAADKMLIGTVNRAGKKFIINGNIVDVGKGKIDFAEFGAFNSVGEIEKGAEEYSRRIAARISGVDEDSLIKKKPRWPYVWRSTLLPGWGQWKEGQRGAGAVYFGLTALSFANYGSAYSRQQAAQKNYSNTVGIGQFLVGGNTHTLNYLILEPKKARFERARSRTKGARNLVIGIWALSILDAFFKPGSIKGFFAGKNPARAPERRAYAFLEMDGGERVAPSSRSFFHSSPARSLMGGESRLRAGFLFRY